MEIFWHECIYKFIHCLPSCSLSCWVLERWWFCSISSLETVYIKRTNNKSSHRISQQRLNRHGEKMLHFAFRAVSAEISMENPSFESPIIDKSRLVALCHVPWAATTTKRKKVDYWVISSSLRVRHSVLFVFFSFTTLFHIFIFISPFFTHFTCTSNFNINFERKCHNRRLSASPKIELTGRTTTVSGNFQKKLNIAGYECCNATGRATHTSIRLAT